MTEKKTTTTKTKADVKPADKTTVTKKAVVKATKKSEVKKNKQEYVRTVGRRKQSSARVRLFPKGKGEIIVNQKDYKEYFSHFELHNKVTAPLETVGKRDDFDFTVKVAGGGSVGQAEAVRHGIARALVKFNEDYKLPMRKGGFLTRDPRAKERKKPGLKKARRAPQWSKR